MPSIVIWRCRCGRRYRARLEGTHKGKATIRCVDCEREETGPFSGAVIEVQDEFGKWVGTSLKADPSRN